MSCFSKRQYPVETSQDHDRVRSFDGTKPMNLGDEGGRHRPEPPVRSNFGVVIGLVLEWLGDFALHPTVANVARNLIWSYVSMQSIATIGSCRRGISSVLFWGTRSIRYRWNDNVVRLPAEEYLWANQTRIRNTIATGQQAGRYIEGVTQIEEPRIMPFFHRLHDFSDFSQARRLQYSIHAIIDLHHG